MSYYLNWTFLTHNTASYATFLIRIRKSVVQIFGNLLLGHLVQIPMYRKWLPNLYSNSLYILGNYFLNTQYDMLRSVINLCTKKVLGDPEVTENLYYTFAYPD